MFRTERHRRDLLGASRRPLQSFLWASIVLSVLLIGLSLAAFEDASLPFVAFTAATALAGYWLVQSYPHDTLGACNVITLVRAAMVAFLAGALFAPEPSAWVVFSVASLAFALDGMDGWLARRSALTSDFGARFDMETDAALAAFLALILVAGGKVGFEILVLGFARYAFVAAGLLVPRLTADLPPSFRRKAICVVQIATLLVLISPVSSAAFAPWLSGSAALLLIWSFAVDITWLLRRGT